MPGRPKVLVVDETLAGYVDGGGGHWSWALQWLLGLAELADVTWLEILMTARDAAVDRHRAEHFFGQMDRYGVAARCVLAVQQEPVDDDPVLARADVRGGDGTSVVDLVRGADLVLVLAGGIPRALLEYGRRTVLLDGDPGHLQAAAQMWDAGLEAFDLHFTAGLKVGDADCGVPTLGLHWQPLPPPVYLPMWAVSEPPAGAPVTSVTSWNWEEQSPVLDGQLVSTSKRLAHLRYVALPMLQPRRMELVAQVYREDGTGDREVLERHGWTVVDPLTAVRTLDDYRRYLSASAAELSCPKPVYRQLRTGWLSDRSAAYLASGRPVVAEDTGVGDHLPLGEGLLSFRDYDGAVAALREVDGAWARHAAAARRWAEEHLDSRTVLGGLLERCAG